MSKLLRLLRSHHLHLHHHRHLKTSAALQAKLCRSAEEAVSEIPDGARIMVGGFGLCGIPENSIRTLSNLNRQRLTVISNNGGIDDKGLGKLLLNRQLKRVIGSYVGENKELEKQYLTGQVEIEFVPQGTLAERIRARAAGIPAFFTPTGYGTQIHEGGAPIRYSKDGQVEELSRRKEERLFNGKPFIMEEALQADYGLIKAWKADRLGNIVFNKTAQNFNAPMCRAADRAIVEVEQLVEVGDLPPEQIHVPAVYVHSFYVGASYEKPIEKLRYRLPGSLNAVQTSAKKGSSSSSGDDSRIRIAKRAALEVGDGDYVNLGIAAATPRGLLVPNIKDAQDLSLRELAIALHELTQTARAGRTQPGDMQGGTLSITNIGALGIDTGTPIINPGEAAIVAFGTIKQKPWVVDGDVIPRWITTLGGSFDHRVVDGATGARFLQARGAHLHHVL